MNLDRIEALLRLVQQAEASELEVEGPDWRVRARKGEATARAAEAPGPAAEPPSAPPRRTRVVASRVGRFHVAETPLPRAGEAVAAGQALGSIESMGILTPVVATEAGQLLTMFVADGQGVEYGQELFEIEPADAEAVSGAEV